MHIQRLTASDGGWRKLAMMRPEVISNLYYLYYRIRRLSDVGTYYEWWKFVDVRKEFYDQLWKTAARNVGAEFIEWKYGFCQIRRGGMTTVVSLNSVMLDDHLTQNVMFHKALTYDLLAAKGFKTPAHCIYTMSEIHKAKMFLSRHHGGSVVVKPASGTGGGRGVTTGITTTSQLRHASRYAASFGPTLLVEEQLTGGSYRLLYLDGRFIDAVRRDRPVVKGDGQHTIRQLVRMENQRRRLRRPPTAMGPLNIDKDCRNKLEQQSLSPASRLAAGETIHIKQAVNENAAGQNHNVREAVHAGIIEAGAKLASDLGVRLAGIDLICSDISIPLSESGAIFSEINVAPGIHHHYLLAEPEKGVPIAEVILDHLFTHRQGVMIL